MPTNTQQSAATSRSTLTQKSKRRSPISRAAGEQRLIDATIEMIREQPFSDVGVRDIAKRADINHGFVHVWFGSKHLLFTAARNHLVIRLVEKYPDQLGTTGLIAMSDPDARLLVRLSIWLEVEGVEGIEISQTAPISQSTAAVIAKQFGMDPDAALNAARLGLLLAVGNLALERTFNWGPSGESLRQQWDEMLKLLAAAHPA